MPLSSAPLASSSPSTNDVTCSFGTTTTTPQERACRSRVEDGLRIKSLSTHNTCLLLKLVHRLHSSMLSPSVRWAWELHSDHLFFDVSGSAAAGAHWGCLCGFMPPYRSLMIVVLGDGNRMAFWLDPWLLGGALYSSLPALFSHCVCKDILVVVVLHDGLHGALVRHLLVTTTAERDALLPNLIAVSLPGGCDSRILMHAMKKTGNINIAAFYRMCSFGGAPAAFHSFVWDNSTPPKVTFFPWLLIQYHIHSSANLLKKCIFCSAVCELCNTPIETATHIVIECDVARSLWECLGSALPMIACIKCLHMAPIPPGVPPFTAQTCILLCCWNLWKHCNGVVFHGFPVYQSPMPRRCRPLGREAPSQQAFARTHMCVLLSCSVSTCCNIAFRTFAMKI